jgi:hypothetical protein
MTEKSKSETLRRKKRRRAKMGEDLEELNLRNPVAKFMNTYNKPRRHADLSKDHDSKRDKYKRWKFGEDDDS